MFQNKFSLSVKFICNTSNQSWILTNIYGPSNQEDKAEFIQYFSNIEMPREVDWIVVGDFNFMRSPSDRNKPGGM